jgi:hypothetical protein
VCREARSVVLSRVQYVTWRYRRYNSKLEDKDSTACPLNYSQNDWGVDAPVRFRQGFDIVHLNWHHGYERFDMMNDPQYPWETFQWLVNHAATASISADLLPPFDPERKNPYTNSTAIESEEMKYFEPRRLYYAVLAFVEIHISAEEATRAGVFGVLGEEPIQLVDPRDTEKVAKFRDVWSRHQTGLFQDKEEPGVAEFFTAVVDDAEAYSARVEQWRRNIEKFWLWGIELEIPQETNLEVWPILTTPSDENSPGWYVGMNRRELNREHPWVKTQLALMPRFVPALMFRHCDSTSGSCQQCAQTFPDWLIYPES